MQIYDFNAIHIGKAAKIAMQNYDEERRYIPALPPLGKTNKIPDLTPYAQNNLGVAAFDKDTMLGFLCAAPPFENAFNITGLTGVFSPMGANGAVGENRANIYAELYRAAGARWAKACAQSHAVCLYAHDKEALTQFYRYGFGVRCVDAIREIRKIEICRPLCEGYSLFEPAPEDILKILPLYNMLGRGFIESPTFMVKPPTNESAFLNEYKTSRPVYLAAEYHGKTVAFIKAERDGETFIKNTDGYLHINGAYCLPEHRSKGVMQNLLNMLIQKLKIQGYTRLGVDFESFNPSGDFWSKYFAEYTHGVVRRIDG